MQSLLNPVVKEFWKSVNIFWSYGQESSVMFFFDSRVYILSCGFNVNFYWKLASKASAISNATLIRLTALPSHAPVWLVMHVLLRMFV